jgi:hypothetical protein
MINKGISKVNQYKIHHALYSFNENFITNKEFEIIENKKYYQYTQLDSERSKTLNENMCMRITYSTSENYLSISSGNEYKELSKGYSLLLSKEINKVDTYKLITDNMVFYIKVTKDFDKTFQNIFFENEKETKDIQPEEIKALFNENEQYYLEFISKNLGLEGWYGRTPNKLETKQLKLDNKSKPYTAICISNSFDLRMLFFKENNNKTWKFIDNIGFGGRNAGIEYSLERAGENVWVIGNKCKGYGTGEARYYQEWYILNDNGRKKVLSFPYYEIIQPPYGGYVLSANDIKFQSSNGIKMTVNYSITRSYMLDLDIADENGIVEVSGSKKVIFNWDEKKKVFESEFSVTEDGTTNISTNSKQITDTCNSLLNKYYNQIIKNIKEISKDENEYTKSTKVNALKVFLKDCTSSNKKSEASNLLLNLYKDLID